MAMDAVLASAPSTMACTGAGLRETISRANPGGMTSAMRTAPRFMSVSTCSGASSRCVISNRPAASNAETRARLCAE